MVNENKVEKEETKEVKDPNVYFVYTHVNKKESARRYENFAKALEFAKQARSIGVVTKFVKVKAGKEEREFLDKLEGLEIEVKNVDESTTLTSSLKKFGNKLLSAVGL